MTNKEKYIQFCEQNDFVPIFSQPWWMDAVCIDGYWAVLLYEKNEEILGALPYYVKKKFGLSYITQPQFTQNNGVVIKYPENQKYEKKLSYEKEVMTALIEQLEKLPIVFYQQNFNCKYTNWLPFYWKGYQQTTCYTYRIPKILSEKDLLNSYHKCKRVDMKKAESLRFDFVDEISVEKFYQCHSDFLSQRGKKISYKLQILGSIFNAILKNKAGKVLGIIDVENNKLVAVHLLVWDSCYVYSLIGARNPDYDNTGLSSLLFHKTILIAFGINRLFDFEGSMIEVIEPSYRRFGTVQTPYFHISKVLTKNVFYKLLINQRLR